MMWLPASVASAVVFGTGGFLLKVGSHKNYPGASMLLGLYISGTLVFLLTLLYGGTLTFNTNVAIFALLVGLGSYYGNSFLVKAYDMGPSILTSPLMNISILLVILLSALFFNEKLSYGQYVGIGCMMSAVTLLSLNLNNSLIKSRMWIVCVALSILFIFMREGGMKVAHEIGLNNYGILFYAYLLASLLAIGKLYRDYKNPKLGPILKEIKYAHHKQAFLFGAIIGICSAIGMGLLAFAIARGPASVVVPIFSTRNFVAVVLLVAFFREKLKVNQWIAVILLIVGIIFVT